MKKRILSSISAKRLLLYSQFSTAFVLLRSAGTDASVVYTDIAPDAVIENDSNSSYYIDIDDNLIEDFHFLNVFASYGGYWTSGSIYYIPLHSRERINVFALGDVSIAGNLFTYGSSGSTGHKNLAYAIEESILINDTFSFRSGYIQWMAYYSSWWGAFFYSGGHWYPESLDHYLGVRFKDAGGVLHYGWIRCDVKDEGRTLVIKDYAYETEPDYPIVAGDTIQYVAIKGVENTFDATVYSFGRNIYILADNFHNTDVIIYDMHGEQIIKYVLQNSNDIINMTNCAAGLYTVTLVNSECRYVKKVLIE